MKKELAPHERAARVIRLMGWLGLLFSVGITAAIGLPALESGTPVHPMLFVVIAVIFGLPISLFLVARGLFRQRDWARWTASAYSLLALFGIPIGTLIGGYVLWQLSKGWPPVQGDATDDADMRVLR